MTKNCDRHLVFLGPPGSGKGSQAALYRDMGYKHFSTGDILRNLIKKGSPLGLEVKDILDRGDLVSDEKMKEIIHETFRSLKENDKFILDGYPRTLKQGLDLEGISKDTSITMDKAVYFDVTKEVVIERISSRRICPKCNAVYNIVSLKPSKEGICDKCGNALIQRDDDKEESVLHRLDVYLKSTATLIDFYRERGLLKQIDANGSIENTNRSFLENIELCPQ